MFGINLKMRNNVKIKQIAQGVNFNTVIDDRFKSERISVNIIVPLEKEKASQNAILPFVLSRTAGKHNTFRKLNVALSELYGADIYPDVKKIGENHVMSISAAFLSEKYTINKESIMLEVCDLLCNMLFRPNLEDDGFIQDDVEQEKRQLIESIKSEYNDKRIYAKKRCIEIMCDNEKFSVNVLGTTEQLESIDRKKLYIYWQELLKNSKIEIMFVGTSNANRIKEKFKQEFENIERNAIPETSTEVIKQAKEKKMYCEKIDVQQAKLVMGYRTKRSVLDDDSMATRVMVGLLGGTPHSKLFVNVREKMSLCYYCSSMYHRMKGIMLVQSGVENANVKKTIDAIEQQIEALKNGDFTQNELDAVKLSIENGFRLSTDSIGGLEAWYLSQLFEKKISTVEETIEKMQAVTREDIISAAKDLSADTIYVLSSEGDEIIEEN